MSVSPTRTARRRGRWPALLVCLTLATATLSATPTGAAPPEKPPKPGTITTVAGGLGDHKQATTASLWGLNQVALDPAGENLYITTGFGQNRVRKLDLATGIITTAAGSGFYAEGGRYPLGDGGPATQAGLAAPFGVTVDDRGNLYIADQATHRIRKVTAPRGKISSVAGGNATTAGARQLHEGDFCGDGGPATEACLNLPGGVAVDDRRNLFIADTANQRIRRVDARAGIITTVAGGNGPTALYSDGRTFYEPAYCGDGGPATQACLANPVDLELDRAGNLFIVDKSNFRIRRVDAKTGLITTVAGNGTKGYCGDGGPAVAACLTFPHGLAFDASGNLFIADTENNRIRRVDAATGTITTVAGNGTKTDPPLTGSEGQTLAVGDGGPATQAQVGWPHGVAVDRTGTLYIADGWANRVRRVDAATGIITTIAGNGHDGFSGDGGPALQAELGAVGGATVGPDGNLYITSRRASRILKLDSATGLISTVAGTGIRGYGGDGGPATRARLAAPYGVAFGPDGDLYLADSNNCAVRKVDTATGIITAVAGTPQAEIDTGTGLSVGCGSSPDGMLASAAQLGDVTDLAFGPGGALYLADFGNCLIRRIDPDTGLISTVAGTNGLGAVAVCGYSGDGGPATQAKLSRVTGVAVDRSGNLYIADQPNQRIRRVDAATGIITTIAGTGIRGHSGDGGPATQAKLRMPTKLAVDAADNLYIADRDNYRIRRVDAAIGIITTVAGTGTWNYCGDGGPATAACLSTPNGLALDPTTGDLYVADTGFTSGWGGFAKAPDRIRKVTGVGVTG